MVRPTKQFKKFAASGKLTETIKKRRQVQQSRRKVEERVQRRAKQRGAARPEHAGDDGDDDDDENEVAKVSGGRVAGVARTVDELFGGLEEEAEPSDEVDDAEAEEDDEEDDEEDEDEGEDEEMSEEAMEKAMRDLQKKDPDFFKFLQENDRELLDFKNRPASDEDEDEDADEDEDDDVEDEDEMDVDEPSKVVVTPRMLRLWQEGMVKQHSVRSLRKTLLAFRAAAHTNEDADEGSGRDTKYAIDNAKVFNKLVITALKFTPVVVAHHVPFKTLPNGKVKLQPPKTPQPRLARLVLSHFSTLLHLIKTLPSTPSSVTGDTDDASSLLAVAVAESAKLLPWVLGARKHVRAYVKTLLELWASAADAVRVAAFLGVRKLFVAGDEAIKDLCLKSIYRALLPPLRNTSVHTLPSLNLMKNTASDLFQLEPAMAYQHAFGAVRMLAVHLRAVLRAQNPDAFRQVYNWQFVHSLDFWAEVLAKAVASDVESPLRPLIYPLTQIALGVVRLLPSTRYFPLRFHILRSLTRLVDKTGTYIPLAPFFLEILDSSEFRKRGKDSSLRPLDFEYAVRAPAAYPKSRVYQEGLADELVFLLADYCAVVSDSIAFPELVLPVVVALRRHLKRAKASPKANAAVKTLVDRLEASRAWTESRRRDVGFAPRDRADAERFGASIDKSKTPVGAWVRVQRKSREQKRAEVERALREERAEESD
ncbi:Nucleolar Complex 2 protein [Cryptotrichosporon argae]